MNFSGSAHRRRASLCRQNPGSRDERSKITSRWPDPTCRLALRISPRLAKGYLPECQSYQNVSRETFWYDCASRGIAAALCRGGADRRDVRSVLAGADLEDGGARDERIGACRRHEASGFRSNAAIGLDPDRNANGPASPWRGRRRRCPGCFRSLRHGRPIPKSRTAFARDQPLGIINAKLPAAAPWPPFEGSSGARRVFQCPGIRRTVWKFQPLSWKNPRKRFATRHQIRKAELRAGPKSSSTQTRLSEHRTKRGEAEKSECVSGEIFTILGQAAAAVDPWIKSGG